MGRPAASDDVQPFGTQAIRAEVEGARLRRLPAGVGPARLPELVDRPCAGSTTIRCRSPVPWRWMSSSVLPAFGSAAGILVPRQRPVLDRRIVGNRKRTRVRLLRVQRDPHRHPRLVGRHDHEVHVEIEPERLVRADRRPRSRPTADGPAAAEMSSCQGLSGGKICSVLRMRSASGVSNSTGCRSSGACPVLPRLRDRPRELQPCRFVRIARFRKADRRAGVGEHARHDFPQDVVDERR